MLRTLFVLGLVIVGLIYALHGAFQALLFYIWVAYFRPESWVWTDIIRQLNLSFYAGVYLILVFLLTRRSFCFNGGLALLSIFVLHALSCTLFSEHSAYSWEWWPLFFRTAIICYVIVALTDDLPKYRLLIMVMSLSLGLEGAKQGWTQLVLNPGGLNINPIPFLGDNNGVAVGMLMLVPLIDALARTSNRKKTRVFYRFLLVGVLYRALSTYSRGCFLACGGLVAVYWFRSRNKLRVLFGILVVAVIVLPVMPSAFWTRMESILTYEEEGEESALSRLHFWKVAVAMANSHPLKGVGFNAYQKSYDDYDYSNGLYGTERAVHSAWFGVLAELGYVGAFLYVVVIMNAFRNCYRARKVTGSSPERDSLRKYATALETSLVVFVIGSSFLSFQYIEMLWHFIGLGIALNVLASRLRPGSASAELEGATVPENVMVTGAAS